MWGSRFVLGKSPLRRKFKDQAEAVDAAWVCGLPILLPLTPQTPPLALLFLLVGLFHKLQGTFAVEIVPAGQKKHCLPFIVLQNKIASASAHQDLWGDQSTSQTHQPAKAALETPNGQLHIRRATKSSRSAPSHWSSSGGLCFAAVFSDSAVVLIGAKGSSNLI